MSDDDAQVRAAVAYALGQIGASDRTAVLALVKSLRDVDWRVGRDAADALAKISVPTAPSQRLEVVSPLIRALEDDNPQVRANIANVLGKIGQPLEQILPALIYALDDNQALIRANAADALGETGQSAKQSVPALISAVNDEDQWVPML